MTVTGPSFTNSTSIVAAKTPVATSTPSSRNASANRSTSGSATSGGAASVKLGRLPFRVSWRRQKRTASDEPRENMTATRIKPLALYARVSNLGRRSLEDLRSVEMQRAEATVAVRTLGYEVDETAAVFEDLDVSGASEIAERPGLSNALARLASRDT